MNISAELVKSLRESTGVGMMECKKALIEANGDLEKAIVVLRSSGVLKAMKKADRLAKEGIIACFESQDGKSVACVELNCETDFVARESNFFAFGQELAQIILKENIKTAEMLSSYTVGKQNG